MSRLGVEMPAFVKEMSQHSCDSLEHQLVSRYLEAYKYVVYYVLGEFQKLNVLKTRSNIRDLTDPE